MNMEEIYQSIEHIAKCEMYDAIEVKYLKSKFEELQQENKKYKKVIDRAIEYINKYAWQEDIIGGIYTTNGKPATDRYMKLEWDNCNELLDILKGSDSNE